MPKSVSFDLPDSPWDIQRKEMEAERRRLDMLSQIQAQQPLRGDMVSGYYVAPSWTQGLARAVGSYLGRKDREKISKDETKLREEEQRSLVDDVNAYFEKAFGRPEVPGQVVQEQGRMIDPPEYWKPEPAQTFPMDQAPSEGGLQMEMSEGIPPADPEAMGAALATEYGQPNLPAGTDFSQYTQPPFIPPTLNQIQGAPTPAPKMPPFTAAPPMVQRQLPGVPGQPADPKAALAHALASRHKIMQNIGMQQLLAKAGADPEGLSVKDLVKAAQYLDPASLTAIGAPPEFKQLVMRNNIMTVPQGSAVMPKTGENPELLPTTQGRFGKPFQRGKDWYQTDLATGQEKKLDNAANVQVGVQAFEPAFGKKQADIVGEQLGEARKLAEAARRDMLVLDQAEQFLNKGIKTGVLVEPRNYLDKIAVATGFMSDDPNISNTDLMVRTMRQRASAILASGAYGAGTGISEKDLEEVVKVATGKDMTQQGLQAFIRVARHSNKLAFDEYQRRLDLINRIPGAVPGFTDFMGVDSKAQPVAPAVSPRPQTISPWSEEEEAELNRLLGK